MRQQADRNQLPLFEDEQPTYLEVSISGKATVRNELTRGHRRTTVAYWIVETHTGPVTHDEDTDHVFYRAEKHKVTGIVEIRDQGEGLDLLMRHREEEARMLDDILGTDRLRIEATRKMSADEIEAIQTKMNDAGVGITIGLNDEGILVDMATGEPALEALPYVDDGNAAAEPVYIDLDPGPDAIGNIVRALERAGHEDPKIVEQDSKILWLRETGQVELRVTDEAKVVDPTTGEILGDLDPEAE